uniref:DDE_Tnp_IS1595 domain-containing protein n=1 Tax=Trichuris muris TaxID=70415 RepID=A0A5S6Q0I0_TRIMR
MKLTPGRSGRYPTWRCRADGCCEECSIRKGTWFDGPRKKTPLMTAVLFMYDWCPQVSSIKKCARELGMTKKAVVTWNHWLRQLETEAASADAVQIGGEGLTVEVDETLYSRRTYNVGRLLPQQWVFGGICRETGDLFAVPDPDRSRETLLALILKHVRPGSTVMTDQWVTGAHTQTIESLWAQLKRSSKLRCGMRRSLLKWHLGEQVWRRRRRGQETFERLLNDIATLYPPS